MTTVGFLDRCVEMGGPINTTYSTDGKDEHGSLLTYCYGGYG